MNIQYTGGPADYRRVISVEDFTSLGVEGVEEDVVWEEANRQVAEVSDEAGQMLLEKFPREFVIAEEPDDAGDALDDDSPNEPEDTSGSMRDSGTDNQGDDDSAGT